MRSEKEIQKVLEKEEIVFKDNSEISLKNNPTDFINSAGKCKAVLEWVLEGEPRYSIDEIKKIFLSEKAIVFMTAQLHNKPYLDVFFDFVVQNPEKVKKILEESK